MSENTPFLIRAFNKAIGREQNVRSSFNMLETIAADHARVHAGQAFSSADLDTVAASGYLRFLVRVGGTMIHLRDFSFRSTLGPAGVTLHEAPFVDANSLGTLSSYSNMNRHPTYAVNSSNFTFHKNPYINVNSIGSQIDFDLMEQATGGPIKAAGGVAGGPPIEWMLASSVDYLISFVNSNAAAALVGSRMYGYMGE